MGSALPSPGDTTASRSHIWFPPSICHLCDQCTAHATLGTDPGDAGARGEVPTDVASAPASTLYLVQSAATGSHPRRKSPSTANRLNIPGPLGPVIKSKLPLQSRQPLHAPVGPFIHSFTRSFTQQIFRGNISHSAWILNAGSIPY